MADKTTNYGFSTPGLDGAANITVQDENWTELDKKLKEELDKKAKASDLTNKVDKVSGKGLSANDFTSAYKTKLDNLDTNLSGKVDKVTGKGLSANDFADNYKTKLDNLDTNLNNKVDKVSGKGLSTNDFTSTYKTKLDNLDTNLSAKANASAVLTKTNTTAFTPTADYQPATKKYVDDLATGGTGVSVVDNLTSTSATSALSANQGKVLNDKITALPIKPMAGLNVEYTSGHYFNNIGPGATIIGDLRERTYSGTTVSQGNIAYGDYSVAMGTKTTAGGIYSVAMGCGNSVTGDSSVAMGYGNSVTDGYSVAMGCGNSVTGWSSVAMGYKNRAAGYQTKIGKYGKLGASGVYNSTEGDAFTIGNGTSDILLSNAFRVTYAGKAYGLSAYGSSGADYAEYFEWKDGNPDNEDRRGRLVTLDGEKIRFATADDDYILGIISANPCVEGDIQPDDWQGKYLTDVFGQRLTKTVHIPDRYEEHETIDPETGETKTESILIEKGHNAVQWVLNPDYDPEQEYVSREDRKEWAPVGMMGKLVVIDDGTCEVNGFCKAGENGIATKANDGYRVMSRIDDTHLRVLVK
mgnify:CR=1 FL=1